MNVEGKENFIIRNSLFDIRYSNKGQLIGAGFLLPVSAISLLTPEIRHLKPKI